MAPTYRDGDMLVVDGLSVGMPGPERHDVVIVTSPLTGRLLVKRVAAVAGDQVGIADGVWSSTAPPVPSATSTRTSWTACTSGP